MGDYSELKLEADALFKHNGQILALIAAYECLERENEVLRKIPMTIVNEYTKLASTVSSHSACDRYIQKANGAMEVHRRMQEVQS
ncbi:MAG: hypothetical protein IV106_02820 [Pseudomonas umsongensis]|nr:hypothetical protein [Pseudomonas umsongensis]